jgi:hypothetical protein
VVTAGTRDLCGLALRLTAALIHPVGRMTKQDDMTFFKALLYELCWAKLLTREISVDVAKVFVAERVKGLLQSYHKCTNCTFFFFFFFFL